MPIEIKEVQIKATVANENNQQENTTSKPEDIPKLKKEITKEPTDEVILTRQQKKGEVT